LAARQARQFSREISLGDRWVITRARMLLDPRNGSRGRQFAWPPARSRAIGPVGDEACRQALLRDCPGQDGKTQESVTSGSGNREACGDDRCGSFAIFSDVGLFLFGRGAFSRPPARPVWRTQRSCSADRFFEGTIKNCFKLSIHSHHAWSAARRHCCMRFLVRCARPARGE